MKVLTSQRVGVCVDVQNMYYSARNIHSGRLNFPKLLETIVKERQLIRAIAYVIEDGVRDQSNFFALLQGSGFDVRSKALRVRPDGTSKGDWDMGIALDALALSDKVDVIALVTGDGDFTDLVNFLRSKGVRVEIYSFPESTADSLVKASDQFTPLGEEQIIRVNRQRREPSSGDEGALAGERASAEGEDDFASGIFED